MFDREHVDREIRKYRLTARTLKPFTLEDALVLMSLAFTAGSSLCVILVVLGSRSGL